MSSHKLPPCDHDECPASHCVHAPFITRPQINETCTGCVYKWMKGLCPDKAHQRCKAEKIIFQIPKKQKVMLSERKGERG